MFTRGITFVLGGVVGLFVVLPLILLGLWLLGLILFPREAKKDPVIKMAPRPLTDDDRQFVIEAEQREKARLEQLNPPEPIPSKEWHERWISESIEERRERIKNGLGGPFD